MIHALPGTDGALKNALATMPGLAHEYFRALFPGTSLRAQAFRDKGFMGYNYSAQVEAVGTGDVVGVVCIGGNGGTVFVSLTGAGCQYLHDLPRYALTLEAYGARITRADLAVDDLSGESLRFRDIVELARNGGFKGRGKPVALRFVDDLGTGKGRTLYVGKKGAKELCLYEKGIEQGAVGSPWIRAEARLWSKNRVIPYDVLTNPAAYVVGEYPALAPFLPQFPAKRSQVVQAKGEATVEAAAKWLREAGGKTLDVLRVAAEMAGAHPGDVLMELTRPGMPRRFAGQPKAVVMDRAERRYRVTPSPLVGVPELEAEYDETGARVREEWNG